MSKGKRFVINIKRILKTGWRSFWRNAWLSAATILVMLLAIFVVTGLVFFNVVTQDIINDLKQKVDVSVYFKQATSETDILAIKTKLEERPEVLSVQYVSKEEALEKFKEAHKDDEALLESLRELDQNPLQATLNIKADSAQGYEQIAGYLENSDFSGIDKINYLQNREIINRLSAITDGAQRAGFAVSLVLAILAVLVAFNTVRLTIYSWREEISVKRLVGATNWNIRGPFLVEGMIYGVAAALLTMLIVFPLVAFLSPKLANFLPGQGIFVFLRANFFSLLFFQILVGVVLGGVSSFIAIRRYLK